jgi:hypothetical protein
MKKRTAIIAISLAAVVLVFVFAPILPWAGPVSVFGDTRVTAQASPSYYLLNCGVVYNLAIIYTENGQVASGGNSGAEWRCLRPNSA